MLYIYDGDEVAVNDKPHDVVDGKLVERDSRSPLEKRLDEIESRLASLERAYVPYVPYTNPVPCPDQPWTTPYVPGTTWVYGSDAGNTSEGSSL